PAGLGPVAGIGAGVVGATRRARGHDGEQKGDGGWTTAHAHGDGSPRDAAGGGGRRVGTRPGRPAILPEARGSAQPPAERPGLAGWWLTASGGGTGRSTVHDPQRAQSRRPRRAL